MDKKKRPANREIVGAGAGNSGNKTLEEALRESEERYRQIFEQDRAVKLLIEPNTGKILKANRAAAHFYGYPTETLQQLRISDINQLDPAEIAAEMQAALLEQRTCFIFPHRLASGEVRQVEVYSSPIDLSGKRVLYSIIHDITDRKVMDEALRESEEKYRVLFNNEIYAICIFDLETLKLLDVNKAYCSMYGYSREELVSGMTIHDITAEKQVSDAATQQAIGEGTVFIPLRYHRKKDGSVFPVEIVGGPYTWMGRKVMFALAHDIADRVLSETEHKRTEEELRESEARFRRLSENSPDVIYRYRLKPVPGFEYVSPASVKISGYTPEDYYADPLLTAKIVHPEDLDRFKQYYRSMDSLGTPLILRWIHKAGHVIWSEEIDVAVYGTNGELIALEGVARDMTERKKAEVALKESETRLREVLENSLDASYKRDLQTNAYDYLSPTFALISGYTPDEMNSLPLETVVNLIHPEDSAEVQRLISESLSNPDNRPYRLEYRFKHKQGYYRWVQDSYTVMRDGRGQAMALIGSVSDITERKKAESRITQSETLYRTLVETSPDAIGLMDMAGTILMFNKKALEVFGFGATEDLTGKNIMDMVAPENYENVLNNLEKLQKAESIRNLELTSYKKDGQQFWLELSSSMLFDEKGRPKSVMTVFKDITERKQVQNTLRASEEKYRLLANNASDVIWTADMDLNTTYISPSIYAMQGHTPEEAMNLTPEQRYTPESLELISKRFIEVMANEEAGKEQPGNIGNYEAEYIRKDGSTYWTETSASFIRDATGKAVGILGVTRDISTRKQAEHAQRESEEWHRTIIQTAMDGFWIIDMQGRLMEVNEAYCRMSGYSAQELTAMHVTDLEVAEAADDTAAHIQKVMVQGEDRFETRHRRKDGSIFDVEISVQYRAYEEGGRMVAFLRDVTEHKRAEEALCESERRSRKISELTNDITYSCLTDENGDYCIDWLAGAAEQITGYTADEIMAQSCWKFMVVEKDIPLFEKHVTGLTAGQASSCQLRICNKKGEIKWVNSQAQCNLNLTAPLRLSLYGGLTDITDRKRLEEEQQRVAKLESVGLLAGGIAHDFNNILTSILGNISLARMEAAPGSELLNSLEQAEKASQRAKALTVQLLTFSKGGAPVLKLSSLTELLQDTASFAMSGSKVRCNFSIPANLWHAEVDAGQVSQVIHNLVINAQQAMPAGGSIEINAENIALSKEQSLGRGLPLKEGDYVRIAVTDHGIGIPEDHLEKIFDPFFTTKQQGNGMGLATSFSIAHQHGGHLSVESGLGAGSTFYLYLPASMKKVTFIKDKKAVIKPADNARILVMDDESGIRGIADRLLKHIGYKDIEFAEDGVEAIKLYKAAMKTGNPFTAVILDLTIPGGMGGEETIRKLLKIDPGVKAIVSSGYIDDPVIAKCREYGFSGMVAKPYTIEELRKAVQDVIG